MKTLFDAIRNDEINNFASVYEAKFVPLIVTASILFDLVKAVINNC